MLGSTKTGDSKAWKVFSSSSSEDPSHLFKCLRLANLNGIYICGVAKWQILIMDRVTVKVMSKSCKMADITDQGISCKNNETMIIERVSFFLSHNLFWILTALSGRRTFQEKGTNAWHGRYLLYPTFQRKVRTPSSFCLSFLLDCVLFVCLFIMFLFLSVCRSIVMFLSDMSGREPLYRK